MTTTAPAANEKKQAKFWTPVFRVSYPNVFKARKVNENDPEEKAKFSLTMIFPKTFADANEAKLFADIKAAVSAAAEKEWGADRSKWPTTQLDVNGQLVTVSAINSPWNDGAKKKDKPGYGPEVIYASATSYQKPGIVSTNRVIDPITGKEKLAEITEPAGFYAGCYARATVTVFIYKKKKLGVSLGLRSIQFIRDGEALGGSGNPQDDFDSITPPSGAQPVAAATPAGGPAGNNFGV